MANTTISAERIIIKRAYEEAAEADGTRILVERLWPRGISKEKAALDDWMKDIAPSTELRKWFSHDAEKWPEFQRRYRAELADHQDMIEELRVIAREGQLTLVYGSRDKEHNGATVLRDVLLNG